jgi:hypothetical protein
MDNVPGYTKINESPIKDALCKCILSLFSGAATAMTPRQVYDRKLLAFCEFWMGSDEDLNTYVERFKHFIVTRALVGEGKPFI